MSLPSTLVLRTPTTDLEPRDHLYSNLTTEQEPIRSYEARSPLMESRVLFRAPNVALDYSDPMFRPSNLDLMSKDLVLRSSKTKLDTRTQMYKPLNQQQDIIYKPSNAQQLQNRDFLFRPSNSSTELMVKGPEPRGPGPEPRYQTMNHLVLSKELMCGTTMYAENHRNPEMMFVSPDLHTNSSQLIYPPPPSDPNPHTADLIFRNTKSDIKNEVLLLRPPDTNVMEARALNQATKPDSRTREHSQPGSLRRNKHCIMTEV